MSLTGGTVIALAYKGGVAMATDRTVFASGVHRFQNNTRQYRLNNYCLISFSGDFAEFQWLQNLLERRQMELQIDAGMDHMKPKMVHAFLTSLFYQRRSKMNPFLNTMVVCGMQSVEFHAGEIKPFIGVIDMRGNAYEVDHVATEIGKYLLRQMLETRQTQANGAEQMSKEEALRMIAAALEVSVSRNSRTGQVFDVSTVDAVEGVKFHDQVKIIGKWDEVEVCDGTYN
ncbi:hypothetical protein niasHT_004334 [Heterodera trifolii]|uniref:Proteasome subunit beta n=1 Tax=Heterodera trifolii TaxID=157864 RepID=A0ABD2IBS5_9BILA